jgi:Txe/YoeB family toxin of toxin-antitoxin system
LNKWQILVYRDVTKHDIPLLIKAGLKTDFDEIIASLKVNPYRTFRNFEKLNPHNLNVFSLRINAKHRVVYTINKRKKIVKIWSAWSHYEQNRKL